jgi:hypothetical protein
MATWNGRSDTGATVMPGVYFLRLDVGEFHATRKVIRVR